MYNACIFDLDGTLANTLQSIATIGNSALNTLGYTNILENRYKQLIGDGVNKLIERMLTEVGGKPTDEKRLELKKVYDDIYSTNPIIHVKPYDEILDLLKKLNKSHIPVCVLSNKPHDMTVKICDKIFKEIDFFEVLGHSERFPTKPSPLSVNYLTENLNSTKVLYIGDSGVDMQTANNAKLDSVGVLWGFRDKEELLANNATYIASSVKELDEIIFNK